MAKELTRVFDHERGAVIVRIQADGGPVEVHTLYVGKPDFCDCCGGRRSVSEDGMSASLDVEAEIQGRLQAADANRAVVAAGMRRAGWKG